MSLPVWTQPRAPLGSSDQWTSGICDCCQAKNDCCLAFWCCPCFACRTSKQLGQCLCLPLLDVCGICVRPITMSLRVSVRHNYGIRGTLCRDCVYSCFCLPCVWCQISREMKDRELPATLGDIIRH